MSRGARGAPDAGGIRHHGQLLGWLVLACLAYVPALRSSRGRMPADSKLFLYLDPTRFLGQAASTFDPAQYGGWVPHQHVAYLWPTGPYYWLMSAVGAPDWVAQRLWIGTLMFAAGTGAWWCVRRLGFTRWAAFTAAIVFQLSVYLLPYISRTSVMLLPWAGLGWIVGLTVQASLVPDDAGWRQRWRAPALISLVVATVGAVNATATLLIAPAPALWLLHAGSSRVTPWRRLGGVVVRTSALCVPISTWWIVMLWIQGRFGAPVLPLSETLADVSFTSSGPEVWRGLGYWLFYIRDLAGPTTSASYPYLVSGAAIAISYTIPIIGLVGTTLLRWPHRRFAVLLIGVGAVLAVGVHPFDHPAPWTWVFTHGPLDGLALALRSSTRAMPVMVLGIALGCAACADALGRAEVPALHRVRTPLRVLLAVGILAVAIANVPSLRHAQLVDPMLIRDERPPQSWIDAAAVLNQPSPASGRVLQVPGIEFGDYRWGVTIDQPVAGLTDKPLITRDLLPLGSVGMMDVLYAFDDRIQAGVLDPQSIGPVADALGVDRLWLTGDLAYDRYRVARPADIAAAITSVGAATTFGEPVVNAPTTPSIDERTLSVPNPPIAPVTLVTPDRPGAIVRAERSLVAVSGSGDGIVDSTLVHRAARGAALVYTADRPTDPLGDVEALVITDSNRHRNRHWRSSLDATGETLGPDAPVGDDLLAQRLPLFANSGSDHRTVAEQSGPLRARSDTYGEPFGYQPEHRAFMAVDGDPDTAWTVGEHGEPRGASIVLTTTADIDALNLQQFAPIAGQRRISELTLAIETSDGQRDQRSVDVAGPAIGIDVDAPEGATITLTIDDVTGGEPNTEGIVADVGFTEITALSNGRTLGPTTEWIRPPIDANASLRNSPDLPLGISLRRERVSALNVWRSDPEPTLRRVVELGIDERFTVAPTVRIDSRADDRTLANALQLEAWSTSRLRGAPQHGGFAAVDGDAATSWMSAFDGGGGAALTFPTAPDGADTLVDELTITQPNPALSQIIEISVSGGGAEHTLALPPSGARPATVRLDPPLRARSLTITATAIDSKTTIDRRFGDRRELPVAISEIGVNARSPKVRFTPFTTGCSPVVMIDGVVHAGRISVDSRALAGAPAEVEMCDATTDLAAGEHFVVGAAAAGFSLDNLDLTNSGFDLRYPAAASSSPVAAPRGPDPRVDSVVGSARERLIELSGCVSGCWLVFGEGYNDGWSATADNRSLGNQILLDGTSNGWWVPAEATTDGRVAIRVAWTQQRPLNLAFFVSALTAIIALALASVGNRAPRRLDLVAVGAAPWGERLGTRALTRYGIAAIVLTALIAGWYPLPIALGVAGLVAVTRRSVWARAAPPLLVGGVAVGVVMGVRAHRYVPDGAWPSHFDSLHPLAMTAVALLLASSVPWHEHSTTADQPPADPPPADAASTDVDGIGSVDADSGPPVDRAPADTDSVTDTASGADD